MYHACKSCALSHWHLTKAACSAQCGCSLQLLNVSFSCYVAQIFSKWYSDVSSCLSCYWYHICFLHSTCSYLYCKVLFFKNISTSYWVSFLSPKISVSINKKFSFFFITDYGIQFIIRDGFSFVDSKILLCYVYFLFLLILVHAHISVPFPNFPFIWWSEVEHTLSCRFMWYV
jgi:hypothetical protein